MHIFLSYGHADTKPLADTIEQDLVQANHVVWRDINEITVGQNWRERIVAGLTDTDLVLALLSPHAVREHGVCLDEIAIAMHHRHGAIATIMAAPEAETQVPASIGHLQWLDMQDWATHWNTPGWEAWYAPRCEKILEIAADPNRNAFTGEISALAGLLDPVIQTASIAPLIDGFVGREWLVQHVNSFRSGDRRMFWLTGGPGAGKSAFSAWITHYARANVAGLNLCEFGNEDRTDAAKVIRTLAFLIATRLPDYRRILLAKLRQQDPDGAGLRSRSALALFDFLLSQPLLGIDGGRRSDRFVLVIDALDESVNARNESVLAEVLSLKARDLPAWMALIVTSRPDLPVAVPLGGIAPFPIDEGDQSRTHLEDIAVYAQAWLGKTPQAAQVAAASEGNFMYLRQLHG